MPKKPEPKPVKVWRIINSYTGEPNSPHNYWTKPPLKAGEIAVRCRIVPEASYRKLKRLEKLCRELVAEYKAGKSLINLVTRIKPIAAELRGE